MRVRELFALDGFAGARLVAGDAGNDRDVRWAHVVDLPDPAPWVEHGQLLLTTGLFWPSDPRLEREQLEALAARGVAAVGLAVSAILSRFSPIACDAANRLALPLIEIPWEMPFARITAELHRTLIVSQQNTIARSEEIHRSLTRCAQSAISLLELADHLGRLLGRSIMIEDEHSTLLAVYNAGAQPDAARREMLERAQSPRGISPRRVAPISAHDLERRIECPIRIGDATAGYVFVIEGAMPFAELDRRAAEHAALVAALKIAHQRELTALEERLGYASFLSLLEAPAATDLELERARLLGFDPTVSYRVGIVQIAEPLPLGRDGVLRRDAVVARLRGYLGAIGVPPMLGASLDRIPFLLPHDVATGGVDVALRSDAIRIAFGRPAIGTEGVRSSYREAQDVLRFDNVSRSARYEDALVPRVLLGDAHAREAFVTELFGGLAGRKGAVSLREAILTFADHAFAFRRTAEALNIHPNTLRYRLERAATYMGLSFDDPDVRFRLQLAARLLRLSDLRTKTIVKN